MKLTDLVGLALSRLGTGKLRPAASSSAWPASWPS